MTDDEAIKIAIDALFELAGRSKARLYLHPRDCQCSIHVARRALFAINRHKLSKANPAADDSHAPDCFQNNYDLWLLNPDDPEHPVRPNCNCKDQSDA